MGSNSSAQTLIKYHNQGRQLHERRSMSLEGGLVVRAHREHVEPSGQLCAKYELPVPCLDRLKEALYDGWPIEIHTTFPDLLARFPKGFGFDAVDLICGSDKTSLSWPGVHVFHAQVEGKSRLVLTVDPNPETARFWALSLANEISSIAGSQKGVDLIRHVDIEDHFGSWGVIDSSVISPHDVVILCFTDEMRQLNVGSLDCSFVSASRRPYMTSNRYRTAGGALLNFLTLDMDIRGSLSAELMHRLAYLGVRAIIPCLPMHSIGEGQVPFGHIYSPSRFIYHMADGGVRYITKGTNPLHECYPASQTGWHLSSHAVFAHNQIDNTCHLSDVCSVDMSISAMAAAVEDASHELGTSIPFCPMGFAVEVLDQCTQMRSWPALDEKKWGHALRIMALSLKKLLSLFE